MTFASALILLILVMDPLGNVPLFLVILEKVDPARRRRVLVREMLIALVVLIGALLVGPQVMKLLGLENLTLQIAGGIVLFIIAMRMIFPGESSLAEAGDDDPLIVPLAIPLVAGPSALAAVLLLSSQYPQQLSTSFYALIVAWAVNVVILACATRLRDVLGAKGLRAMERLMGMVLVMVATQMFIGGVRDLMRQVHGQ